MNDSIHYLYFFFSSDNLSNSGFFIMITKLTKNTRYPLYSC